MTHVRQSVVGVVIFLPFFLHDPVGADKNVLNLVNIYGQVNIQMSCMHFKRV